QDRPKTMLDVKGQTILERQVATLGTFGVRDVTVVRGYKKEQVVVPGVRYVDNDRYRETGELHSLFSAAHALAGPCVVLYGDILFEPTILERLLRSTADVAVVVDRAFRDAQQAGIVPAGGPFDLVVTETPANGSRVLRIGPDVPAAEAHGEFIGMALFSARGAERLRAVHAELEAERAEGLERASITQILQALVDRGE